VYSCSFPQQPPSFIDLGITSSHSHPFSPHINLHPSSLSAAREMIVVLADPTCTELTEKSPTGCPFARYKV